MIFIGIDPGKSGAMAIIKNGNPIHMIPFDEEKYIDTLDLETFINGETAACIVEKVSAMPGQGVTSMFHFGENFGFIQGILKAFAVPYELVTPQKWKKEFSVTSDKNTSIEVCKRLFPNVNLKRTDKCKKDHDGLAEALLLAEYAKRHFKGNAE